MLCRQSALPVSLACLWLASCAGYDLTVNDQLVYSPPGQFADFQVGDTALRDCLTQAIADQGVTAAEELSALNCSHAGIGSLDGLATFAGLTHLKLSSNRILNLLELQRLQRLQVLHLDGNRVVDHVPIYSLRALRELDLSANPGLQCPSGEAFIHLQQLNLPDHCMPSAGS